jgi:hypothetical protein
VAHRSFRVPAGELRVIAELDGRATVAEIAARVSDAALVEKVVGRFARYGFLLATREEAT